MRFPNSFLYETYYLLGCPLNEILKGLWRIDTSLVLMNDDLIGMVPILKRYLQRIDHKRRLLMFV